jgi:tripartite-type tricarboxylate transporter receptor subunit TctC
MRRHFLKVAAIAPALALAAMAGNAWAQAYPAKPIRMVLGYPAGSGIDNVARQFARHLEKSLGKPVYVDNKPGALGNIAAQNVATSAPDGYSILFTPNSSPVANVHLFKKLPFDPIKDFTPIAPIATLGFVLLINPQTMPVKNLAELTALLKKEPGKHSYGIGNAAGQVAGALYTQLAGLDVLNVPYKGVPPAVADLIGGRLDFVMADASLAIPQIKGGRVEGLAVTSKTRIGALSGVPTMTEAGLPEYDLPESWFGIFGPANIPREVTTLLERHARAIVTDKTFAESLRLIGVEPLHGTSADLAKMVAIDTVKWGQLIKRAGIEPE